MTQQYQKGCNRSSTRAEWEQHIIAAARTNQDEEEEADGKRTEGKKQKTKRGTRKKTNKTKSRQINLTLGGGSNMGARLCYKTDPGTLPHPSPSPSDSCQKRYQLSNISIAAVAPPPIEQLKKKLTKN